MAFELSDLKRSKNEFLKEKVKENFPLSEEGEKTFERARTEFPEKGRTMKELTGRKVSGAAQSSRTSGGRRDRMAVIPPGTIERRAKEDALKRGSPLRTEPVAGSDFEETTAEELSHLQYAKLDPELKETMVDTFEQKAKNDPSFRRHMYYSLGDSTGYTWSKDVNDYLEDVSANQFNVKQAYYKISPEFRNDFINELRAKQAIYYARNPAERANSDIMELYPEFARYTPINSNANKMRKRNHLANKVRSYAKNYR